MINARDVKITYTNRAVEIPGNVDPKTGIPVTITSFRCMPLPGLTKEVVPMIGFCTESPLVKILPYSDGWELATIARFRVNGYLINAPKGFKTDFASIPTMFQNIIKVNGKHRLAALMHDYLYSVKGRLTNGGRVLNRKQCDQLFLQGMKECGVKYIKRYAMYRAVRLFGGIYWNSK